jgi:fructose-specific phosphotransferase system IIB component
MKIVAVTACPTGVALTYMAAERLGAVARRLGHSIKIETQGALGTENTLVRKDIVSADIAIFAADIEIKGKERFHSVKVLRASTADVIETPEKVLQQALEMSRGR